MWHRGLATATRPFDLTRRQHPARSALALLTLIAACRPGPAADRPQPPAPGAPRGAAADADAATAADATPSPPGPLPDLPALAPSPAPVVTCSAATQPELPADAPVRGYEFEPVPLAPVAHGVVPPGARRHPDAIRAVVMSVAEPLAACVQDAARRGVRQGVRVGARPYYWLSATLTIDPFGAPTQLGVDGDGDPVLHQCVRAVLGATRVPGLTARHTVVTVPLRFPGYHDGARPLPRRPRAAPAPASAARAGCVVGAGPPPGDTLALTELEIPWLPGQARSLAPGGRGCPWRSIDKRHVRAVMEARRHQFEACLAAAPATRGVVTTRFTIGPHGVPVGLSATGAGDPALHACFVAALGTLSFQRSPDRLEVVYPFALGPATPAASYLADCAGRAAQLAALGLDDPRAWPLVDGLAAAGCADAVALDRLARRGLPERELAHWRGAGLAEAAESTARVLAAVPAAAPRLLPFLGEAQATLGLHVEARATLLQAMALPGLSAPTRERLAEAYAAAAAARDGRVPLDGCWLDDPR